MVDPIPPNIGLVGVAWPAEANRELVVLALVDGVELAAGFAPPNRPVPDEDAPPKGLAAELAPAAVAGVLEVPPNTLDGDAAGLFSPENREFAPPAGGVPVDAAPPNNDEGVDEAALVVEAPPNSEPAGFEALAPPKRPPLDAAGCPGVAALSFCALPKEKPLEGAEAWLPNSEVAGVDEDDAPDVAWFPKEKDMLDAGVFQRPRGCLRQVNQAIRKGLLKEGGGIATVLKCPNINKCWSTARNRVSRCLGFESRFAKKSVSHLDDWCLNNNGTLRGRGASDPALWT